MSSFRAAHAGASVIVCGCGESLNLLEESAADLTIGVNDVGRKLTPTYLVVVNPRSQFPEDRLAFIEDSTSQAVFSQLKDLRLRYAPLVRFQLGAYNGTEVGGASSVLHYTQNSPYVALCLAAYMGASRIGLIGVDFTDHHFFGRTGRHSLAQKLAQIDAEYQRFARAFQARGIEVFNLSPVSRLTAFRKATVDEFRGQPAQMPRRKSLHIVSYSTTPVAGVPEILARCISARTAHRSTCVWASGDYGNGVRFEGGVEWRSAPDLAARTLAAADLVIVHNGKVHPQHRALLARKPVITMAHNYAWNVDTSYVSRGLPGVVVAQYQAALPEFAGWHVVPNPLPFWEELFSPAPKPGPVRLCFTPSGAHERYPAGHRLYWHAKGYHTTLKILDALARTHGCVVEATRGQQISHAQALAMKRRAHIVIDECVTGSYHRNSLEGLAAGCVVVNAVGALPAVVQAIRHCVPADEEAPFEHAELHNLQHVLTALIDQGPDVLCERGRQNRLWLERNWDFQAQWQRLWEPAVAQAMAHQPGSASRTQASAPEPRAEGEAIVEQAVMHQCAPESRMLVSAPEAYPASGAHSRAVVSSASSFSAVSNTLPVAACNATPRRWHRGVSVVVPHGGTDRLPHLRASLANLAQARGVGEVIVAEMGCAPHARELAQRWGAKYVFIRNEDVFERARTLNVGSALAAYDLVLWKDNDLLLPEDFIEKAEAELRGRNLDHLLPYTTIRYLSAGDSCSVMGGTCDAASCRPEKMLQGGRQVSGGASLVTSQFLQEHGGIPDGFRGWGGEDNAWMHKARLLGRSATTRSPTQVLFHLHHEDSGAHRGAPNEWNPYYADNVALLEQLRSVRTGATFVKRFPDTGRRVCPWDTARRIAVVHSSGPAAEWAEKLASGLHKLYGIHVTTLGVDLPPSAANSADLLHQHEAVVVLDDPLARILLSDTEPSPAMRRVVFVSTEDSSCDEEMLQLAQRAGAVIARDESLLGALRADSNRPVFPYVDRQDSSDVNIAMALVPALSLVLADSERQIVAPRATVHEIAATHTTLVAPRREPAPAQHPKLIKNVFACLVHENQDCVIDLVRNLRYHDPTSLILLYDGGRDPALLRQAFPFERYGAVVCPASHPMQWGYLHPFALDCMRFALEQGDFDTLTIVDSDQLAVRGGYSAYLSHYLRGKSRVGMLGSSAERQTRATRIAPAANAWREVDLWRPFLRRFPRGEEQFLYWSFWPSTVFTREAAEALISLFREDQPLREILDRSRIWATEEVILPTLVALLGFDIYRNPCSGEYVQYKKAYSPTQINLAMKRTDVFWIHPVPRRYDDPLRARVRNVCGQYVREIKEVSAMQPQNKAQRPMLLTTPILQKMRPVEGWMEEDEADLLIAAASRAVTELPASHGVVEIGSYCGRSTVVLGSVLKTLSPSTRLYAIDPHDGKVGALDQGIRVCAPTLEKLKHNLAQAGVAEVVEIITQCSYDVPWNQPISLLLIDGLHDYANVARDFHAFESWIAPGGYIAFHDYATYYPGVMAFVDELLRTAAYRKVHVQRSMALLQKV